MNFLKPVIDFFLALILLILFSPVLVCTYFILLIGSKMNPVFIQMRPGYKGKPFKIYKFKTMTDEKNIDGKLLPDEDRLTLIGRIIRKTSLDELPQLINVLKGDISLVGPRPLIMSYLPLYNADQARRHNVKPGITGWAQVNGRDAISWNEKFKLDLYYVENQSFLLDVRILFKTVINVLSGKDESPEASETMAEWFGNDT
ncbi:sugar transferase [Ancylomarina sp. 16SWW S1-10-2]|uniref:sugar transferase n=1 Tax=Ancylomarina sp. 16SWW S1-10-2 TaxID=2499681 RepID=UPI0027146FA8|nr:sugar transferase [Ancylomarina sp. 16SWW S1-10-2]